MPVHIPLLNIRISKHSFVPRDILIEACRTLCLLLPADNKFVTDWYKKKASDENLDTGILKYGPLPHGKRHLGMFNHFRDRLVILKQHYDDTRPSSFGQLWHDQRDFIQFLTVMNAITMVIFTLITLVFGAVQIGVAIAALNVAKASLKHDQLSADR